jgi:ABC-type transport system involved in cytochrome c biogenesis permease subunit
MLKTILKPFASLTLTVILLALSMVLIYAGTLAQVDKDIWQVQHEYFHSAVAWVNVQDLVPRFSARPPGNWGKFPFPGGYVIGGLLLANLLAAHAVRFKFSPKDLWLLPQGAVIGLALYFWQFNHSLLLMIAAIAVGLVFLVTLFLVHQKRAGVIVIHLGLILLLIGEGITSGAAKEGRMEITEGSYANYSSDIRSPELAVVDTSDLNTNRHVVVSPELLKAGATINDARLPFVIKVDKYFANSRPVGAATDPGAPSIKDDSGPAFTVQEQQRVNGVGGGAVDLPSAFVTLTGKGQTFGPYLLTVMTRQPQVVEVGGRRYEVSLRFERDYKPYSLYLKKFSFDRYTGTNVPKNYSSDVKLIDPAHNEERDVRIWMNHPLRYRGETFFQADFDKNTEKTTILQVVRNPAAPLPYVAIAIALVGLVVHFGIILTSFLARRTFTFAGGRTFVVVLLGVCVVLGASTAMAVGPIGFVIVAVMAAGGIGAYVRAKRLHRVVTAVANPGGKKFPDKDDRSRYELAPQERFMSAAFLVPAGVLAFCLIYVAGHASPRPLSKTFDLDTFAKMPLSYEGRVQPFDSLARNALKVLRGRESAVLVEKKDGEDEETKIQPVPWLLDVFARKEAATKYKIFRLDHPDVKSLLGLDDKEKFFSLADIEPNFEKFVQQVQSASQSRQNNPKGLSQYQTALLEMGDRVSLYRTLMQYPDLHIVPPADAKDAKADWVTLMDVFDPEARTMKDPVAGAFAACVRAYSQGQVDEFNRQVREYERLVNAKLPGQTDRSGFEAWFNRFDPFVMAMVFYVMVFVLAAFSWIGFSRPLARSAFWVLGVAFVLHTFGLAARIYMSGRPPVTNLASSAIFIGWGMVVFAVCLELIFRNGIGSVAAAIAGFPTLMIAQRLSLEGDTMKVLQAVLDTNIWLATHVVTITLGYAATFLAGLIGIVYITLGVFTKRVDADLRKTLGRMMYGITCFAILFSFVGTILGGIWADQSWGRFWGWDPKENGAVLIVLANAIFLHARWGGLVKERGMANIAIFGNIVTAWSYFGTNMLGVGLHSYGFMSSAVFWLLLFIGSQLFFIGCGLIPTESWRSRDGGGTPPEAPRKKGRLTAV